MKWHYASQRQPKTQDDVLIVRKGKRIAQVGYYFDSKWWVYYSDTVCKAKVVDDVDFWADFAGHLPNGDYIR